MVDDAVEKVWGSHASLLHSTVDGEAGGDLSVDTDTSFSIAVHSLKESGDLSKGSKDSKDLPEGSTVKGPLYRMPLRDPGKQWIDVYFGGTLLTSQ